MKAIEEELVAGESPDKSVDEGKSGTAESSEGRDPRASVFRPRDPEEGRADRDPLREAVAAWVATAETSPSGDEPDEAPAAPGAETEVFKALPEDAEESASDSASDSDSDSASDSASDSERRSGGGEPAAPSAESERTAVFRTVTPPSAAAERPAPSGSASEPEGGEPADPSGASDGSTGPTDAAPAGRSEASGDKPTAAPAATTADEPADGDRETGSRTATPPVSDDQPESSDSESGSDSASTGSGRGAGSSAPPAVGERTAAFRTATPPVAPDRSAGAGPADDPVRGAESPGESAAAAGAAGSERTASFRTATPPAGTGRPAGSGSGADPRRASGELKASAGSTDSERTAVFRTVTPPATADRPTGSAPAAGDTPATPPTSSDPTTSERTATFRTATPPPAGAPTSGAATSGTPSAQGKSANPAAPATPSARDTTAAPATPATGDSADSERTAVFRAVKPGSGSGSAPGAEAHDSERTAVFRAVKPPAPAAPAAGDSADSERTAVFRAIKPGTAAAAPDTAKPAPPHTAGGERPSTFVPLRNDAPARPATGRPPNAASPAPGAPRAANAAAAPAPARTPVPAGVRAPVTYESPERTTQQPLPPKPPLDMLADLTNNPPPPPSAARTVLRRFKIYAPVLVLLAVVLAVVQLVRPLPEPTLRMTAKSTYAFEGGAPVLPWPKEGQAYVAAAGLGPVGTFGEQKPVAIGSVAKAMTAYVILKDFPMKKGEKGQMIPVDKTAVDDGKKETEGESTVNNLKEGDKLSQYDALAAIMIPSANNVARLLARWDGGQEAFVQKMNDTAKELGMTNTAYTDPSGLNATTVSTAEDQVKLGLKIVEMPELIAITKLPYWTDATGKKWRNYNNLIPLNNSLGIKTGSTTKAGGNLLFAASQKVGKTNQLIVGAVLGQHGVPILDTAIEASKKVMIATQRVLTAAPVVKKGAVVGYVDDGLGTQVPVVATADVEAVGWPTLTVSLKLGDGAAKLPQTAKAGSEIGVLTVGEGASQVKVPVALQSDLTAPGVGKKLTRVG
ncbi:hypothetical protein OTB20_34430 [Streptomyces sp. H27-H1]|uniref:D-alanyl-D-alanine carboxypeptidase n=1 Tax=Streptomyces sp. H27-H1 TaxID=2996461 RepID=UPI0022705DF3|nr:serine hydrolase [Streptomyces sp. H27-H1]MCY0931193.1 hypothetical protein [Streptomyces sp. H27-H1]